MTERVLHGVHVMRVAVSQAGRRVTQRMVRHPWPLELGPRELALGQIAIVFGGLFPPAVGEYLPRGCLDVSPRQPPPGRSAAARSACWRLFDVKHYCRCMSVSLAALKDVGVKPRSEGKRRS